MLELLGCLQVDDNNSRWVDVLLDRELFDKGERSFILRNRGEDIRFDKLQLHRLLDLVQVPLNSSISFDVDAYTLKPTFGLHYWPEEYLFTYIDYEGAYVRLQFKLDDHVKNQLLRYIFCAMQNTYYLENVRDVLKLELDVVESFLNVKEK